MKKGRNLAFRVQKGIFWLGNSVPFVSSGLIKHYVYCNGIL